MKASELRALPVNELEAKMNEIGFSLICNVEGNKIKVFFEKLQ